jgi:hypothetical protein
MLKITLCLDNRLTDGGQFVSLTFRQRSTPQIHFFSGTHFRQRLIKPQGLMLLEEFGKLKKEITGLIGSQNRDLPACSIMPQPLLYRVSQATE